MTTLIQEFRRKGISLRLLPSLLKDIEVSFKKRQRPSRHQLNVELEDLGWGIRIIDQQIYQRILHALQPEKLGE